MESTCRFVVLCLALLLPGMALKAQTASVLPELIESDVEGYVGPPLWVSARAAMDKKTILKQGLLGEGTFLDELIEEQRGEIEREGGRSKSLETELKLRTLDQGNCTARILLSDHLNDQSPAQSFRDLLEHSKHILEGTVVASEVGFYRGAPASLLNVKVDRWLRASDEYKEITHLYVYHSAAHFMIGPYEFCGHSPGLEPRAGDKIMVFDFAGLAEGKQNLLTPGDDKVFAQTSSGRLLLPMQLRQDPVLSRAARLNDIADLVRQNSNHGNDGSSN